MKVEIVDKEFSMAVNNVNTFMKLELGGEVIMSRFEEMNVEPALNAF